MGFVEKVSKDTKGEQSLLILVPSDAVVDMADMHDVARAFKNKRERGQDEIS